MSFFPVGFDPRDEVAVILNLVSIDTGDAVHRFILGGDGKFTDVNDDVWWGSSAIQVSDLEFSINGTAPSASLSMSFIADPDAGDLIAQVKALGLDYIFDRDVQFWIQPLQSLEQFDAPVFAPILFLTRKARAITSLLDGPLVRSLALSIEARGQGRNTGRGYTNSPGDHARLIGEANPSLEFAPTDLQVDQPLFG